MLPSDGFSDLTDGGLSVKPLKVNAGQVQFLMNGSAANDAGKIQATQHKRCNHKSQNGPQNHDPGTGFSLFCHTSTLLVA